MFTLVTISYILIYSWHLLQILSLTLEDNKDKDNKNQLGIIINGNSYSKYDYIVGVDLSMNGFLLIEQILICAD